MSGPAESIETRYYRRSDHKELTTTVEVLQTICAEGGVIVESRIKPHKPLNWVNITINLEE